MANEHKYPVALKWDQGTDKLKSRKNKLLAYFQNKSKSGGGECMIRDYDCSRGYILIDFQEEAAQKGVLEKKNHQIKVDVEGKTDTLLLEVVRVTRTTPAPSPDWAVDNTSAAVSSPHAGLLGATAGHTEEWQTGKRANWGAQTSTGSEEYFLQPDANGELHGSPDSSKRRKQHIDEVTNTNTCGNENRSRSVPPNSWQWNEDGQNSEDVTKQLSKMDVRNSDSPGSKESSRSVPLDSGAEDSGRTANPTSTMDYASGGMTEDNIGEQRDGSDRNYPERADAGMNRDIDVSSYNHSRDEAENLGNVSDTTTSAHNINAEPRPPLRPPKEFFTTVIATLQTDLYNKTLKGKMAEIFPTLTVKVSSDGAEVKGTFKQIEAVYNFLQQELRVPGKMPPSRQNEERVQEMNADHVCVPSALCDYVMEIYQMELEDMERRYKVKIVPEVTADASTYIKFMPQGLDSSVEAAKDKFTEKVQNAMSDWSQEAVDSSSVVLPFSDIRQCLKSQFTNILVIQEGEKIILRGPKEEIFQAKRCLEKGEYKLAHPPRPERSQPPRPVSISTRDMKTEIPIDARHLDILRKLKNQEICNIEKKYNVMLAEKTEKNGSLAVTFTPVNGSPDLSPHAAHSFITLLQRTFFNIKQKVISIKSDVSQDHVCVLEEQLKMAGVNVIMEYSKSSVVIIGHTRHVAFAEEMLTGPQKLGRTQAVAPSRGDTQEPMDTDDSATSKPKAEDEEDKCPVCLCEIEDKVTFPKCKHVYCRSCLERLMSHKPVCAICGVASGEVRGNQPDGTMTWNKSHSSLPGFHGCGTIEISYSIPGGIQKENHPHPGRRFHGTSRTAYLPDNREGNDILQLLRKAFDQRLIFTVGDSRTTGATDTVTWNDVHHKTSTHGGPQCFGYPDPDYLKRVRDELKAKGVE